ncbi:MAG: PEP-CTERM sorting domain-containing protein [Candidatus Acidiferrales bacterium]
MEKKFLAFTVITFGVFFAARSAHADSIRLSDLKLDPSTGLLNSRAHDGAVVSDLFDGDFSFQSLISGEWPEFAGVLRGMGEDELSLSSDRTPGFPIASHLVRRVEFAGPGSKSDDSGPTSVPEPASALLAGLGILGLSLFGISNRNKPPLPPMSL